MQWAFYSAVREAEQLVKELNDPTYTRLWRYFQISDHLYYMFTSGGGPGDVHNYFSPHGKPTDAFLAAQAAFMDYQQRLRTEADAANQPFIFRTSESEEGDTGTQSLSLRGFQTKLSTAPIRSLEYHRSRRDFEEWARHSLRDLKLAEELGKINPKLRGENLRAELIKTVNARGR
jgi:alpha-amylase